MEGTSGPGDEGPPPDKGQPPPPPSPLSGAYLLIIVGEPHSEAHKEDILRKIANGFKSWDPESCHVSLDKEIQNIISQAPEGEEARHGERLIQFASENLVTEVLIQPQLNTLIQCVRNLLSSFTKHRHLVHAGYTFASNGSWIVQDGTFSLADLIDAFLENDVLRILRAYENSVTVDIHCAPEGEWSTARMRKESFSKLCRVRVNPDDCPTPAGNIQDFINYISPFLRPTSLEQLLEPSDVVGNIRFSHPTLYVFPGGQGDAALFGINGFNMLVDGGFARKACFWDFTRHLDRLDAVLMTRVNNSNVNGLSAVLRRKKINHVYPQIGHFFCNVQERRQPLTPDADKVRDPLSINLLDEGQEILQNLSHLQLKPHSCYRDNVTEPINLYHKVGHGKLDMYVLSPSKDSKELKEFLSKWSSHDSSLFSSSSKKFGDKEFSFPIQNLVSICALLVWQPANPSDTITRILFPGSTPQHKIFEGLDKLKHLEFMKHPVCSAKTLTPSSSNIGINAKFNKQKTTPAVIDKLLPGEQVQKVPKSIPSVESVNKQNIAKSATIPVSGSIIDSKPKTHTSRAKLKTEKTKTEKTEVDKTIESETKVDKHSPPPEIVKKTDKIKDKPKKTESKIPPKIDKKTTKVTPTEKKTDSVKSSPTTPKKIIENKIEKVNGVATKSEISKVSVTRASNKTKASPSSTPAKSAKEENNRKVVESKHKVSMPSRPPTGKTTKKEETKPKVERKVAKKTTTASPTKAVLKQSSPAKTITKTTTKKKEVKKVKSEVEKGVVTDSSAVSTPSTVDAEMTVLKETKTEEKITEHVKDDKENIIDEKEKQIEEDVSKDIDEGVEIKDKEESLTEDIAEEEKITKDIKDEEPDSLIGEKESEKEEEDEILIIEKVEVEQYADDSIQDQESIESHVPDEVEDEIQKHMRDEAESEKKEKHLEEAKEEVKKAEEIQKEELETEEVVKDLEIKGVTKPTADLKLKLVSTLTTDRLTPENKEQIFEEVQDIILSATEIAKSKLETAKDSSDISAEGFGSDEQRTSGDTKDMLSSGDKLNIVSDKNLIESTEDENKLDDTRDKSKDLGDVRYGAEESQPDEKFSTTVESGATTAPTLPEDERIPLDEIKEGIEEKYIKEDTKEKDIGVPTKLEQPTSLPQVAVIGGVGFETRGVHVQLRDIVKTPDEVADLPVHEEVDGVYEDDEFGRDIHRSKEDLLDVTPHKEKDQDKQVAVKTEEKEPEENKANIAETEIGHVKADEDELMELKMIRQKLEEDDVEYKPSTGLLTKDKEEKVDISSEMKTKDDKGMKKPTEEIMEAEKLIDLQSRGSSERFERDSYELYTDSGVEEELVHGVLKAPEVPELITVPTNSAPESPHYEVDKIKTKQIDESKTELDEDKEQDIKDTTDLIETQDTTTPKKVENEISITPVVETKDKQEITKEKDLHAADMIDKEHATSEDTIEKIDDVKQVDIETSLEKLKEEITPTELTSSSADLPAKDTDIEEPTREIPTKEEMSEVGKIVSDLQEDKLKTQLALKDESISSEKHEAEPLESKVENTASFEVEKKEMEHEIQLISEQDTPNLANEIITKINVDITTESTIPPRAEISAIEKDIEAKSISAVLSDKDDITSLEKEKTLKIPPISEKEELETISDKTAQYLIDTYQIESESEKKDIEKLICSESTEPNKLEEEHLHSGFESKSASPVPSEKYEPLKEEESPKSLLQTEKHELMDVTTKDDLSKDVSPTPSLKDEHGELQDKDLTSKSISPVISEKDEEKLTIVEKDSFKNISPIPSEKDESKLPDGEKYSPKSTSPVPSEKDEPQLTAVEKHSPKSASPVPSEKDESKLTPAEKDSPKSSSPVPSEKDVPKLTTVEKDSPKSASPVPSEKDESKLTAIEKDSPKSASPVPSEKDEPKLTAVEKHSPQSASPIPSEKDEPKWVAMEKDIVKSTSPVPSEKDEPILTSLEEDIHKSASPIPSEKDEPTLIAAEMDISKSASPVSSEKDEPILTAVEKDISKSASPIPSEKDEVKLTAEGKDISKSASPVPYEKEEPTWTAVEKEISISCSPVPSEKDEPKLTAAEKDSPKSASPIISEKEEPTLTAIEKDISKSTSSVPPEKDEVKLTAIEKDSPKSASPVPSEKEEPTLTVDEIDSTRSPTSIPSKKEEPKLASVEKDSPKSTSLVPSEKDESKLTAVENDTTKSTSSPVPSEKDEPKLTAVEKHSLQTASPVPSEKDELELTAIEKDISKSTSPVPSEKDEPKLTTVEKDSTKSASPVPLEKEDPKLTTADKDSPKSTSPVPSERDEPKLTVVEKDSTKSASPVLSEKEEPELTDAKHYSLKSISPVPSETEESKLTAAEKDSPKSTSPVAFEKDEPRLTTVEKDISKSTSPVPSEKDEATFTAVEKDISKSTSPVPSEKDEATFTAVEKDISKSASPVPSGKDESELPAVEKDSLKSASPVPPETDGPTAKDIPKSTSPIPSERDELKFLAEEKDISKSASPVLSEKDEPKLTALEKSSPKTTSPVPFEKDEPTLTGIEKDICKSVSPIPFEKFEPKLIAAEKEIAKSISPVSYEKDESKMTVVEKDSPKSSSPVPSEKEEGNVSSVEKSSLKSVSPSASVMDEQKLSTEKDEFNSMSPVPSEKDELKLLVTDKESPKSASPVLSEKGETKLLAEDKEESFKIVSLLSSDKEEAHLTTKEKDSSKSASPVPSEIHERKLSETEKDDLKSISPVPSEKEKGKLPTLENVSPKSVSPTPSEIINERKLSTTEKEETHKSTSPLLSYKDESKSTGVEKDIPKDASPVPSEKDETKLATAGKESPKSVSPVPSEKDDATLGPAGKESPKSVSPVPSEKDDATLGPAGKESPKRVSPVPSEKDDATLGPAGKESLKSISPVPSEKDDATLGPAGKESPKSVSPVPPEKDEPTLFVTDKESIKSVSPVPSEKEEVKLSTTEKESSKSVSPALSEMDDRKLSLTENDNLKSNSPVPSEKDEPRTSISDKDSTSPVFSEKDESKVLMTEKDSPKSSALPDERKQSLTEKEFLKGVSPIPTEKDESKPSSTGKDSPNSLSPEPKEILEYKKYTTEKDDFKSISPVPTEKDETKSTTTGKDSPKSISPSPSELGEQKLSTSEKDHSNGVSPVPSEKEESKPTTAGKDSPKSISPLPSELDERKISTSEKDHLKGVSPVPSEKDESKPTIGKDSTKSTSPLPSELDERKLSTEKDSQKDVSPVSSEKEDSKLSTSEKGSLKTTSPLGFEIDEQHSTIQEKDIISKNIEMDKDSASFKDQSLDLSINNQILADKHTEVPSKTNDLQSDISPNGFSSITSGKYELQAKIDHDLIPKSISPVPFEPEYLRVDKLDGYEPPKSPSPVGSEKKKMKQPVEEKDSTHKISSQIFSDDLKLRESDFLTSEKNQEKSSEELLQGREIETHKDEKDTIVDNFNQEKIKTTEKELSSSKKYDLKSEDLNDTLEEIEKDSSKITFHESEILEKSTTDKKVSKIDDYSLLEQTEESIFTPGKTDVKEILLDKSLDRKLSEKENLEKVISSEDYIIKSSSKSDVLLQKSSTTDSPDIQEKHDPPQLSSSLAGKEDQYLKEETFESSKLSISGSPQQLNEDSQDFSSTKADLSLENLDKEVEKTLHTIRAKEDTFTPIAEKIDITDKKKHKDELKEQEIINRNLTYSEFTESKQESFEHSLTYSDKQESQKEKESEISKIEVKSRLSLEKDDLDSISRQSPDTSSMHDTVTEEQLTVEESKIMIETKKDDKLKDFTKHSETSQISLVDKKDLKQEDLNAITKISETVTTSDETKESTTIHETTTSRLKEVKHDEIESTGIVKESFESISSKFTGKEEILNKTSIDLAEHKQQTSFTDTKTELVNGKSYEGFQSTIDNGLTSESSTAKSERILEETTVRRMVVTATSEDGGLETELCTETNQFDETISSETKLDKTKQSQIYEIPCKESVIKSVTTVYKQGTHEDDNTTRTTETKEKEHTKYETPSKESTTKSETSVHEDEHEDSKTTTRIICTEMKLGEAKTVKIEYETPSKECTTKSETVYTYDTEHEDGKSVTTTSIQSESEYKEYDIPSKESIKTTLYMQDDKHIGETTNIISSETKLGETKESKHEIPSKDSTTKIETTIHHDHKHDLDKTFTTTKTIYGEDNSKTILTTVKKVTTTELPTIKQEIKIIKDDMPASAISILRKETSEGRSGTPGSDFTSERDYELGGPSTPHSDISSGQVSRAATNVWSRHGDSDDDVPCSPMSATSHVAHSPLQFDFDVHRTPETSYYEETPKVKETKISSAMTSSLYGSLPQEDPSEEQKGMDVSMYSSMYVSKYDDESDHEEYNVKGKFESMFKGEDVDYQTALMEHRTTRGEDISKYTNGKSENGKSNVNGKSYMEYQEGIGEKVNGKSSTSMFKEYTSASSSSANQKFIPGQPFETSSGFFEKEDEKKKDPIESWGKPLGLPPPPPPQRLDSPISPNSFELIWNPEEEWGEPLGLPSPAPPPVKKDSLDGDNDLTPNSNKTTPKKMAKKSVENNKTASNISAGKEVSNKPKRSESPVKRMSNKDSRTNKPVVPMYMDLTYVPHHGNSHYTSVEFFKRVRARYYVFSGTEPSRDVFNALLEAKQTWEDKDLEVTIIPTYDTDTLGYWVAENEEILAKYKIDLSPSASRCTINLQDHDTSCSAYRLEF